VERNFEFVELTAFSRDREEHFSDDGFSELQGHLQANPDAGDTIEGTGGVKKIRASSRKYKGGKSGGVRVIYYFKGSSGNIYLIAIYSKRQKDNITKVEAKIFKELTRILDKE